MRISKLLPLTCAAVLFVSIPVRADDTAAQAAARAALMQKMQEMNDQPADAAPAPAELPAAEPAPAPAPAPAKPAKAKKVKKAKTPAPTATPAPAPVEPAPAVAVAPVATAPAAFQETAASAVGDNSAQAAARAALLQKMNEPDQPGEPNMPQGLPEAPPQGLPEAPAPVMAETPAPAIAPASPELAPTTTPETPVQATARAALMQKMQEMNMVAPVAVQPETVETAPPAPVEDQRFVAPAAVEIKKKHPGEMGSDFGFKPIVAPAVPVSSEKELELKALLERYKADLITPEQYHVERAQIMGTP